MEAKRIDDVTLEHISSDGSGTEADLAAFKAACRTYQDAHGVVDEDAIEAIFGDGDFWARVCQYAPREALAADLAHAT